MPNPTLSYDFPGDRLDDRVVVVTGAGSGIGRATAVLAAERGATVLAIDIDSEGLGLLAAHAEGAGLPITTGRCDITNPDDVAASFAAATHLGPPVRGVANCAGITGDRPFDEMGPEHWGRVIDINLTGAFHITRAAIDAIPDGGGSIVLISSGTINTPQAGLAHYVASKAGIVGLTKSLAKEFGGRRIRVNAVSPGAVDTPLLRARMTDELVVERSQAALLGRIGRPEDLALAICFLLGDQTTWITGQTLNVNGGSSMPG